MVQKYKDYRPTQFDSNIEIEDRGEWLVVPVMQTRDSGCVDQSNFASALEILGGESDTVEVHRFGHWGPGRIEIIIVDSSREADVGAIEASLEDYLVLDESDLSERESEAESEAWDNYGARDIRKDLVSTFELSDTTSEWFTDERLFALYCEQTSLGTTHSDEGPRFDDNWIWARDFSREKLAAWIRKCRKQERAMMAALPATALPAEEGS